jgi:hypothetical protein
MAADDVFRDTIYIRIGREFTKAWPMTDSDTDLGFDATGCKAVCEVRTRDGQKITRFHTTDEVTDGTITLQTVAAGANVILNMDDSKTVLLPPLNNGRFELVIIDPVGDPWTVVEGPAHILQEVTDV